MAPRRVDVEVVLTPPCIFCIENHEWNIQGAVRMTLISRASGTLLHHVDVGRRGPSLHHHERHLEFGRIVASEIEAPNM